ncbi:MAG: hypothetical protein PHQ43_11155 [Dehalococcoidales bacterium]|nr:hypothetical protein [Dehalococcoidales bacterium]
MVVLISIVLPCRIAPSFRRQNARKLLSPRALLNYLVDAAGR